MNYDKIILEMLSRIQALEEEVQRLREESAGDNAPAKTTTADIRAYIEDRRDQAAQAGEAALTLRATEIHGALGLNARYRMVCNAMRQCMRPGDEVLHETPSGFSSSLEIRYHLDI